jgi:hypothetical protein
MPLIRRRDQILSAAIDWLDEVTKRSQTKQEEDVFFKLEKLPQAEDVTESILRSVGKMPEPMDCDYCAQPIHNGWEFVKDLVCLRCLSTAQKELSRL